MSFGLDRDAMPIRRFVAGIKIVGAAGSATPLVPSGIKVDSVSIKAHPSNSVVVYIGPSGSEVYPLSPGTSIDIDMVDLQKISVSGSSTANQELRWVGGRF